MTLETYTLTLHPCTFKATIYRQKIDEDIIHNIRVGGKRSCIYITFADYEDHAYIGSVKHDPECVMHCLEKGIDPGTLQRSHGTVKLVHVALKFVLMKFEHIKGFLFIDQSTIQCKNDMTLQLPEYYIAKHGKTW